MTELSCHAHPQLGCFGESTFEMVGHVVEILHGCGIAAVVAPHREVVLNRGTEGVHFDGLQLGQAVTCTVGKSSRRVLLAQQETILTRASKPFAGAASNQKGQAK